MPFSAVSGIISKIEKMREMSGWKCSYIFHLVLFSYSNILFWYYFFALFYLLTLWILISLFLFNFLHFEFFCAGIWSFYVFVLGFGQLLCNLLDMLKLWTIDFQITSKLHLKKTWCTLVCTDLRGTQPSFQECWKYHSNCFRNILRGQISF